MNKVKPFLTTYKSLISIIPNLGILQFRDSLKSQTFTRPCLTRIPPAKWTFQGFQAYFHNLFEIQDGSRSRYQI